MNCQLCGNEGTQTYDGIALGETCAERARFYAESLANRLERLRKRTDKVEREARADIDLAHACAEAIPFGQPILVGHHSERRDRNYRQKIENGFRRGYEALSRAKTIRERADTAESNRAISSDDPLAVVKLREKLVKLEDDHQFMRRVNAAIRKALKQPADRQADILASTLSISLQTAQKMLTTRDCFGDLGFAPYQITNNSANIRRIKARIADLERHNARAQGQTDPVVIECASGARVEEDLNENRVRIHFPGKPDPEIIALCKRYGFRWSPANKAWQRYVSSQAKHLAEEILTKWQATQPSAEAAPQPQPEAVMTPALPTPVQEEESASPMQPPLFWDAGGQKPGVSEEAAAWLVRQKGRRLLL